MKKAFILLIALLCNHILLCQVPDGFNYQGVARDIDGKVIAGANLIVRIGILSDETIPSLVWEEDHNVTTSSFGLFTLVIGDIAATGYPGSAASFAEIDWSMMAYQIRTRIYYNSSWLDMGSAKLFSVPYAMLARNSINNLSSPFLFNGDTVYIMKSVGIGTDKPLNAMLSVVGQDVLSEDALFEVRRQDGQPVFSVFNDGIRAYFNEQVSGKGTRGGFAIGGFDKTKGTINQYMNILPDSTRLYIKDQPAGKGPRGGFAIGSFNRDKSSAVSLMNLTPENYFIGHEAGVNTSSGTHNSFIGYNAGYSNTEGSINNFIGYMAGYSNTTGYNNIFFGDSAGYLNIGGFRNIFMGNQSGLSNNSGFNNVFIGEQTGKFSTDGIRNVFIGSLSGRHNSTGSRNIAIGFLAGEANYSGSDNIYIGYLAARNSVDAIDNVFIGQKSGIENKGNSNVFVGNSSGYYNEGYNNVFIGNESGFSNLNGYNNTSIGYQSGYSLNTGWLNTFVGAYSGFADSIGFGNTFIGYNSGISNKEGILNTYLGAGAGFESTGSLNVFIGRRAGYSEKGSQRLYIENSGADSTNALIYGEFDNDYLQLNATVNITRSLQFRGVPLFGNNPFLLNTFLGDSAGYFDQSGYDNTFIGSGTGLNNDTGNRNLFAGAHAGYSNSIGNMNVFLGRESGRAVESGNSNTYVGYRTGLDNISGSNNVAIGWLAGLGAQGDGNVFLGSRAGSSETGSDRLYIENSNLGPGAALIYGEFDNDVVRLNASVNVRDFLVLEPQSSPPVSPVEGTVYYDFAAKKLRLWNGTAWVDL